MAFNKNSNKTDVSMNTKGLTMANKDGVMAARLSLNFWNKLAAINLNPALPESQRTKEKVYDYESFMSIILSPAKASTLVRAIENHIIPVIKGEKPLDSIKEVGVDTQKGYVGVGTGAVTKGEVAPYLILKELEGDSLKTVNELIYEFKSNIAIIDFDDKGGYTPEEDMLSELYLFTAYLNEYIKASTLALIHMAKDDRKYYNKRAATNIESVMTALNIPVQSSGNGYTGNKYSGNRFSKQGAPSVDTNGAKADYSAKEESADMSKITGGAVA